MKWVEIVNRKSGSDDSIIVRIFKKNKKKIIFVLSTFFTTALGICLSNLQNDGSKKHEKEGFNDSAKRDSNKKQFPKCKNCNTDMTDFDGVSWYTCRDCGDSVRIIDGEKTSYSEIFKNGKKEHSTDFSLADFCRGGDITED